MAKHQARPSRPGGRVPVEPLRSFFSSVEDGLGPLADLPDDVAVTFNLRGEQGGVWTVRRVAGRLEVLAADTVRPDCRLTCSVEDFQALLAGTLDSRSGFLEGRLEVEGDVGLVLRLERALERAAEVGRPEGEP